MLRLFKSFIFKITHDITFRITVIVGAGVAIFMAVLFALMQNMDDVVRINAELAESGTDVRVKCLSGPSMLLNSVSPVQNFGIAIPVNLISFVCLEFSQGVIRNKIISGHSKIRIYFSLLISGLIFTFILLGVYLGICTLLGTIFGGFNLKDLAYLQFGYAQVDAAHIGKILLVCAVTYISIVSFALFIATLFRTVGPCIPIVMVILMLCYLSGTIISALLLVSGDGSGFDPIIQVLKIVNPLFAISGGTVIDMDNMVASMPNDTFFWAIGNNLFYAITFTGLGVLIFAKRDVK